MLERFGYVVTAHSVAEALAIARAQPPDLIVSDLHMPEQSGFDLIRIVKADQQLRDIAILMHSATVQSEQDRLEAIRLGAKAFSTRPTEPLALLAEIAACLPARSEHHYGNHSGS
jgi:CheY-like chemotaxis protein